MAYFDRLRTSRLLAGAALAFAATGCSMHPLPEDVSRASTYDIVARVRCEVYEALQEFKKLEGDQRRHAENIIRHSAVGFDFIFDITEGNNIKEPDGKPGLSVSYRRPSFKDNEKGFFLDATAKAERERKNTRRFRVVDDLAALGDERIDCRNAETNPNRAYPVTGATGMGEVVRTYIKLEMLSDLRNTPFEGDGQRPDPVKGNAVTFSDVLKFTTKLSAGVNPKITLTTVAGDLRLSGASFFGSASRDDIHTVIVALASDSQDLDTLPSLRKLPPDVRKQVENDRRIGGRQSIKSVPDKAQAAVEKDRVARSRATTRSSRLVVNDTVAAAVVRNPRAATALIQYDSDARTNVLLELQRLRDLEDDELEAPRRLGDRLLKLLREPD
jgi:hypothetical protein